MRPADTAGSGLIDNWRFTTVHDRTPDEHAIMFQAVFDQVDLDWTDITGVAVSSGVPRVTTSVRGMIDRYLDIEPVVLGTGVKTGMPVLYDNPHEVGADRIANAVACLRPLRPARRSWSTSARRRRSTRSPATASTSVVPSRPVSRSASTRCSAGPPRLRAVELIEPRNVVGKTTVESMQSGTVYGFAAQVDGLVRALRGRDG